MNEDPINSSFQSKIMNPFPQIASPSKSLNLKPPKFFEFPLQQSKLQQITLIQHSYPPFLNKSVGDNGFPIKLQTYNSIVYMLKDKQILMGTKKIKIKDVRCFGYSGNFLLVSHENKSLSIYEGQKLLKEVTNFSDTPLNQIHVMSIDKENNFMMLTTSDRNDITLRRLQKGFFSSWSCKFLKTISHTTSSYIGFKQLSHSLKQKYLPEIKNIFVCCISFSQITILQLNNIENTYYVRFSKNYPVKCENAYASWGQAIVLKQQNNISQKQSLVLTYSFGKNINQVVITQNYSTGQLSFRNSQSLVNNKQIIFCQYMKDHELVTIHEDGTSTIHYTKHLDWWDSKRLNIQYSLNYSFKQEKLKPYVKNGFKNYFDIIFYESSMFQVYCLESSQISIYELSSWDKLCQQLKQKKNYEGIMRLLTAIYLKVNKYSFCFGHTQKQTQELSDNIKKVTTQFIYIKFQKYKQMQEKQILQRMQNEDWMKKQFTIPLQMLIRTDEFDFMFEGFKLFILKYISEKVFYKSLEVFITHGMIKWIPQNHIKKVFNYYISNNQYQMVEYLIVNFDLDLIQKSILIHYCLQNILVSSLAYICTHKKGSNDFITPLVKFFGISQIHRLKNDIQKAQIFTNHAIWYINLCLNQQMQLRDYSEQQYWNLIGILTQHLFSQNMLTTFLILNPYKCLNSLSAYFTMQNAIFVLQYCTIKAPPSLVLQKFIKTNPSKVSLEIMVSLINKCIENAKSCVNQSQKINYDNLFILFLSKIVINKTVKFKKQKYIEILQVLIKNHTTIHPIQYEQGQQKIEQDIVKDTSEYINKVLVQSINQVNLQKNELINLSDLAGSNNLLQVQIYIICLSKDYASALDIYLTKKNDQVFSFITSTFKLLGLEKRKQDQKLLEKEVKRKIFQLVSLNPSQTTSLAKTHFPDSQDQLIKALQGKPILQLQYLQNLVVSKIQISQKSALIFAQLICTQNPIKMISFLRKYPIFPIQGTIKICENHNLYQSLEYLYDKMGHTNKSIEMVTKRIEKHISQFPEFSLYSSQQVQNMFENAITLCIKNKSQDLWQQLLDSIVKLYQKYSSKQWKDFFEDNNCHVLYQLLCHCNIDHCIQIIKHKYGSLNMTKKRTLVFLNLLRNYIYSQNMLYYAIDYQRIDLFEKQYNCDIQYLKGSLVYIYCSNCQQSLDKSKHSLSFHCGHSYHKQCTIKDQRTYYCIKCLGNDQEDKDNISEPRSMIKKPKSLSTFKLSEQAKQLRQQALKRFSQQTTQYQQIIKDNHKGERIGLMKTKMEQYDNVRKVVDEISDRITQKLENTRKRKKYLLE